MLRLFYVIALLPLLAVARSPADLPAVAGGGAASLEMTSKRVPVDVAATQVAVLMVQGDKTKPKTRGRK